LETPFKALMLLVIDPNVVISAVLSGGLNAEIFETNFKEEKYDFIAPEFFNIELGNHTLKIANRTRLSFDEARRVLEFIVRQIRFIPLKDYETRLDEARQVLKSHEKDVPYLALALAFGCKILSGDRVLKKIVPDKIITPRELLDMFQSP